ETVENPQAFVHGNARSTVAHREQDCIAVALNGNVDTTSGGRVANRVIDEIRRKRTQPGRIAVYVAIDRLSARGHSEVDAARCGDRRLVGDHIAHELAQIDGREWPLVDAGLFACERQELLDKVCGTLESGAKLLQRREALGVARRALGKLHLQMERGQRSPQL